MDITVFALRKAKVGIIILRTLIQHRLADPNNKHKSKFDAALPTIDSLLDLIDDF